MNKLLSFLLFFCFSAPLAIGQGLDEEAPLVGQVVYELVGEEIELKAQCENRTEDSLSLVFQFFLSGEDKNSNEISAERGGEAVIAPEGSDILVSTRLPLGNINRFEAILEIYYQDVLMDSDTLAYSASVEEEKPEEEFKEDISEEVDYEGQEDSGLEFGGLVIDNTRTRVGRDFYDIFYSLWEAPTGAGDYIIKMEELPGRGRATRLVVWLDDEEVVEANLRPNYDYLEGLAGYVESRLMNILIERIETGKNLSDDLKDIY